MYIFFLFLYVYIYICIIFYDIFVYEYRDIYTPTNIFSCNNCKTTDTYSLRCEIDIL